MALDNLADIRTYRDQVADKAIENPKTILGMGAGTMLQILDTLLEEIDRQAEDHETGKESNLQSAEVIPLHQRRKVRAVQDGPDLV